MESNFVYMFSEGNASMRNLLGGKGATLADMTGLGLAIPQGFIVSTQACNQYYNDGQVLREVLIKQIDNGMKELEEISGKKFGDIDNPLLVSVRSGARVSMPGMMDTVLNLGLNDQAVIGLANKTGNPKFAYDSYRRFIQMFSDVVMGIERDIFEDLLERMKSRRGVDVDSELSVDDFKTLVEQFKTIYEEKIGHEFPQDPKHQLLESIQAVFRSWLNPRAHIYRRMHGYPVEWGTAVNVQIMVFGNMGQTSGSGVAFSRSPVDGNPKVFGEYLIDAQGEDVVAGIRTPLPLIHLMDHMPDIYNEFIDICKKLENHYGDMQDLEFTIENGKLYILQARSGKRTAQAALKIAVDMVAESVITKERALLQINPNQLEQLLHPSFDPFALSQANVIGKGLPASPGAASGKIVFTSDEAVKAHKAGHKVVLVRSETSPEDIEGMVISEGILTAKGGMTSHAAVVARGMGKPCISGCSEVRFVDDQHFELNGLIYEEGNTISLDGSTGLIYDGLIDLSEVSISGDFKTVMQWVKNIDALDVYANADSPKDALVALEFGAKGIGLCRTEHMFFDSDRIGPMRQMILAPDSIRRQEALDLLLPMQQEDFKGMFKTMGALPVTIRLLDPPLHEFMPQDETEIDKLAIALNISHQEILNVIDSLHEFNPMMGHRGVRLAITYPEIARMQVRAIIQAAIEVKQESGLEVHPDIMVPLVGDVEELAFIKAIIENEAQTIMDTLGVSVKYSIGSMMEVPRAILKADQIANISDFFSFGTNDLTQLTYGFSRDDAGTFLDSYYEQGIFSKDPFASIDRDGVGELMKIGVNKARESKPHFKIGICGEHAGDPSSVEFCYSLGLDYVSCSPFRIPIAQLAGAQAKIKKER